MRSVTFTPNYILNKGKDFSKHGKNGTEAVASPKKRTVIKGAIKTADEIEPRLKQTKSRIKAQGKSEGREKGGNGLSAMRGVRKSKKAHAKPHKVARTVGEDHA